MRVLLPQGLSTGSHVAEVGHLFLRFSSCLLFSPVSSVFRPYFSGFFTFFRDYLRFVHLGYVYHVDHGWIPREPVSMRGSIYRLERVRCYRLSCCSGMVNYSIMVSSLTGRRACGSSHVRRWCGHGIGAPSRISSGDGYWNKKGRTRDRQHRNAPFGSRCRFQVSLTRCVEVLCRSP